MILAADHETPKPALGGVVVQRDARVVEEACQPRPQAQHVRDRLAQAAFRERALLMRPGADRLDEGRRLLPSELGAKLDGGGPRLLARGRVGAGTRALDAVELTDERQDLRAGRQIGRASCRERVWGG